MNCPPFTLTGGGVIEEVFSVKINSGLNTITSWCATQNSNNAERYNYEIKSQSENSITTYFSTNNIPGIAFATEFTILNNCNIKFKFYNFEYGGTWYRKLYKWPLGTEISLPLQGTTTSLSGEEEIYTGPNYNYISDTINISPGIYRFVFQMPVYSYQGTVDTGYTYLDITLT